VTSIRRFEVENDVVVSCSPQVIRARAATRYRLKIAARRAPPGVEEERLQARENQKRKIIQEIDGEEPSSGGTQGTVPRISVSRSVAIQRLEGARPNFRVARR